MWSSFLDQIQQRLDDAADLLGDEEGEEVGVEEVKVDQRAVGEEWPGTVANSSSPHSLLDDSPQPTGAVAVVDGWDDDFVDLVPSASVSTPPKSDTPLAVEATEAKLSFRSFDPLTTEVALDLITVVGNSTNAAEGSIDTHEEKGEADAANDASGSLRIEGEAALREALEAFDAPRLATSHALSRTVKPTPPPPPSADAAEEGRGGAAASSSPSRFLDSTDVISHSSDAIPVASVGKSEETLGVKVLHGIPYQPDAPSSIGEVIATEENQNQKTSEAATQEQSVPPPPTPLPSLHPPPDSAKETGDVAQLLRFQQQLAEEMESVASLQGENSFLKERVTVLEAQLSNATTRLMKVTGSEQQISMLIDKLGKEKERHNAIAKERSELEEHVQDLEEELEEYRVKEQGWVSGSEQLKQNESAAQQRIAQLEKELRARDSLTEDLNAKLQETAHQNGVLQRQVEELKSSYSTQLETVRELNSDTVDQLRREVEQLRNSLQNLSTEYDTRTAELEREVQQSNIRAHQAEALFSEVEFGSVNTLQDLRSELEDSQRSIATWKAEAQRTRREYTELLDQYALLKRSRAAAEAELRDRIAAETTTVAALRKELQEWEARYQALQETLRAAQSESEEQRKTVMLLEAANQKLKTATADGFNRSQSETSIGGPALTKGSSAEVSVSGSPFAGRPVGRAAAAGVPVNPFVNRECSVWNDTTDRKTRERLEQEVLRQSTELERMRQVASENAKLKNRFIQLQAEHDLLLQLYGKLEDDMRALRSKAVTAVPVLAPDTFGVPSPPAP